MQLQYSFDGRPVIIPHAVDEGKEGSAYRLSAMLEGELTCAVGGNLTYVRNVEDTKDEDTQFEHKWAGYWQDKTHLGFPVKCANCNCCNTKDNPEVVGAHVRIEGEPAYGLDAWIAPLCNSCNSSDNKKKMLLANGTWLAHVVMSKPHKTASDECNQ